MTILNVNIKDTTVTTDIRYTEGHSITAGEASALNQLLRENLRNNFATKLEALKAEGKTQEEIQAVFTEYASNYQFGVKTIRASSAKLSPVEAQARIIARGLLKAKLGILAKEAKDAGLVFVDWSDAEKANYLDTVSKAAPVIAKAEAAVAASQISLEDLM